MLGLARRMQRNQIQIQHLLKLNIAIRWKLFILSDSNTTFVKVKWKSPVNGLFVVSNSNTTFVKVKYKEIYAQGTEAEFKYNIC